MKHLYIVFGVVIFAFTTIYFSGKHTVVLASDHEVVVANDKNARHSHIETGHNFFIDGLHTRQSRRAFFSAPPVIPHTIGKTDKECLSCHQEKRIFRGVESTLTPHPEFKNCMQCHVKGVAPDYIPSANYGVNSSFIGLDKQEKVSRAHHLAPPVIPHRLFLHKQCSSCHSKRHDHESGISGPHNKRKNCMQCHVLADIKLDF